QARQAAEEVARVKGEFLSMAAHDLSQPVQSLELVIGAFERGALQASEIAELTAIASTSLQRMRELLKMLTEISRLESGTMRVSLEPVRIA
ncbi:histidine kinase dimerization/phospho-acceptor domain-containing protein, partial [Vibrio parahaemolyticus]